MIEFTLFDSYDTEKENPVKRAFKKSLTKHEEIEFDGVTYRVTKVDKREAVLKMIRYQIPDTATQFVHKCPAKKSALEGMDREDIIKVEEKTGKKLTSRVKMSSHAKMVSVCPYCKTEFWKENNLVPEEVHVDKVFKKRKTK